MKKNCYIIVPSYIFASALEPYVEDLDAVADIKVTDIIDVTFKIVSQYNRCDEDVILEISKEVTIKAINNTLSMGYFDVDELNSFLEEILQPLITPLNRLARNKSKKEKWVLYGFHGGDILLKRVIK